MSNPNVSSNAKVDDVAPTDPVDMLAASLEASAPAFNALQLGDGKILCKTQWGGYVVAAGYNVDVAVGIVRDGIIEPWTTRLVQEFLRPGQTYVNVGANFGYYTSLGGRIVGNDGRVYSFEANPEVCQFLLKTVYYSGIPNQTRVYNRAVFDSKDTKMSFTFDYQFIGGGSLIGGNDVVNQEDDCLWSASSLPLITNDEGLVCEEQGLFKSFIATTTTLDDCITEGTVDLIQCDVEQAEPYVIMGGRDVIRRSPDCRIIIEWAGSSYTTGTANYRTAVDQMWSFLMQEGFNIRRLMPFVHDDGGISVSDIMSFEDFLNAPHCDYVALRKNVDPWFSVNEIDAAT